LPFEAESGKAESGKAESGKAESGKAESEKLLVSSGLLCRGTRHLKRKAVKQKA